MLRTRLIVGSILVALTAGMLLFDAVPWYPFLLVVTVLLAVLGAREFAGLLTAKSTPLSAVVPVVTGLVVAANWIPVLDRVYSSGDNPTPDRGWTAVTSALAAAVLGLFLAEMRAFTGPGRAVERLALGVFTVAYLGLLPSFLVRLRLDRADDLGPVALALAIFVPKGCDIGAYFTGRLIGRHRMTPVLSPKKTWEGAAGGLTFAVLVAFGLNRLGPVIPGGSIGVVLFGLTVGLAGMLGDLAESLIKRDCQQKDASQVVPGFGGVLDVVDAIVFAAPVCYWWLR
jgi:phosphatidate cytidylyltransferase